MGYKKEAAKVLKSLQIKTPEIDWTVLSKDDAPDDSLIYVEGRVAFHHENEDTELLVQFNFPVMGASMPWLATIIPSIIEQTGRHVSDFITSKPLKHHYVATIPRR